MTKQQAIKKSIAHWVRMIEWVKKQPKDELVSMDKMLVSIKEYWDEEHCYLCKLYVRSCNRCPLAKTYGSCDAYFTDSVWQKVNTSATWGEWLIHAKVMLKQLRSLR